MFSTFSSGAASEEINLDIRRILPMPAKMSFEEAAGYVFLGMSSVDNVVLRIEQKSLCSIYTGHTDIYLSYP
tara:strand:- start:276 stop:491 length:216 start_codon:yes stop_codon:yes gene_type:complete